MTQPRQLIGETFGRLRVLRKAPPVHGKRPRAICVCECGKEVTVEARKLTMTWRPVKSCGCLVADRTREVNRTHGMRGTREYSAWQAMLTRCLNPASKDYAKYGAVGITICARWRTFENFLADMGARPVGMTIERSDNTGDYCPGNCRWATYEEQAQNRCSTAFVTVPVALLERALGFSRGNLLKRLNQGWDVSTALLTPTMTEFSRPQRDKEQA